MVALSYSVTVPAEPCSLKPVRSFFRAVLHRYCGSDLDDVVMALDEACANVIKYRCPSISNGLLQVSAEVDGELLRLRLNRFCAKGDVAGIKPRDLADVRPGGLGTAFIDRIMDKVDYLPDTDAPGSVALVMERRITPTPDQP